MQEEKLFRKDFVFMIIINFLVFLNHLAILAALAGCFVLIGAFKRSFIFFRLN